MEAICLLILHLVFFNLDPFYERQIVLLTGLGMMSNWVHFEHQPEMLCRNPQNKKDFRFYKKSFHGFCGYHLQLVYLMWVKLNFISMNKYNFL